MRRLLRGVPVVAQITALMLGMPLVGIGLMMMVSDLVHSVRAGSVLASPHLGLLVGGAFAAVGMSFLWPLVAYARR